MVFNLTHAQALQCISQAEEALQGGQKCLTDIHDCATQMTASSWHGGKATNWGNGVYAVHDDLSQVHNKVAQLYDSIKNHTNTLANFDAE